MDCVLCHEPVTNPLCQYCLAEAISQWLGYTAPELLEDLKSETKILAIDEGVSCVHCKRMFSVCTYCYTKHIFNWLKDGKLQSEFVEYFNFDLYRLEPYRRVAYG